MTRTALVVVAAACLAVVLGPADRAAAHGSWYAVAHAPFVNDGNVRMKGRAWSSEHHRKVCISLDMQHRDDGEWKQVQYGSAGKCEYDVTAESVTLSAPGAGCGWLGHTITETYRVRAHGRYYNVSGNLVHSDVHYSSAQTLSC
jgi:hypothetical protein